MIISDLISRLEYVKNNYGDVPVILIIACEGEVKNYSLDELIMRDIDGYKDKVAIVSRKEI